MTQPLLPPSVKRALILAQQFFIDCLAHQEVGRSGREYLSNRPRPVTPHMAHDARLGYAPKGYHRQFHGIVNDEVLKDIGLLDDRGREVMAGRVTFPWFSQTGTAVIGIGGRKVDLHSNRPKYANSPERPWFAKGRVLFGGFQASAAMHSVDWALIVEGPFDALACWEMGWSNTVATVGAKVSLDQLGLVARFVDHVIVLLDDDEGGRRGIESLRAHLTNDFTLPSSLSVSTAILGGGNDPADSTFEDIRAAVVQALPIGVTGSS